MCRSTEVITDFCSEFSLVPTATVNRNLSVRIVRAAGKILLAKGFPIEDWMISITHPSLEININSWEGEKETGVWKNKGGHHGQCGAWPYYVLMSEGSLPLP